MIAILTKKLFEKLRRKSYREAYVEENVRTGIAYQIRALREARNWSQKKLAELMGKPQSVLSRIEDPDYGKLSVQTLLEVASVFDVGLLVQFVDFPDFINRTKDVSPEALNRESFSEGQFLTVDVPSSSLTSTARPFVVTIGTGATHAGSFTALVSNTMSGGWYQIIDQSNFANSGYGMDYGFPLYPAIASTNKDEHPGSLQ